MTNHEFIVVGAADPQTLPRIVGQLARRWITPIRVTSEVTGSRMIVRIETGGIPQEAAAIIAETFRACVLVFDVTLTST